MGSTSPRRRHRSPSPAPPSSSAPPSGYRIPAMFSSPLPSCCRRVLAPPTPDLELLRLNPPSLDSSEREAATMENTPKPSMAGRSPFASVETLTLEKVTEVSAAIAAAKHVGEVVCALHSLAVRLFPVDSSILSGVREPGVGCGCAVGCGERGVEVRVLYWGSVSGDGEDTDLHDALDKLRFLSVTEPNLLKDAGELDIRIQTDKDNGIITITDSGIGMTREELVRCLCSIAESGTAKFLKALKDTKDAGGDNNLIGQFGVGFYSAFLVSDKILNFVHNKSNIERRVHAVIDRFADRGLRSLAVAYQEVHEGQKEGRGGPWHFIGLMSLFDPPRHDSAETIRRALNLGVSVKILESVSK